MRSNFLAAVEYDNAEVAVRGKRWWRDVGRCVPAASIAERRYLRRIQVHQLKGNHLKIAPIIVAGTLGFGLALGIASGPRSETPVRAESATAFVAADGEYVVDKVHSGLYFKIEHDGAGTFIGRFNDIDGKFAIDASKPESGMLEFVVKAESVDTNNADRDKHLMSGDFFNAKQFPEITFKSKSIKKAGDVIEVTGDLTLTGTTKSVTAKLMNYKTGTSPRTKKENAGFEATFTINRNEFGITKYPGGLGDNVTIVVGMEGVR